MLVTSNNNNHYFFDYEKRSLLLLHPGLNLRLRLDENDKKVNDSGEYYSRKYELLKSAGYFKEKSNFPDIKIFHYSSDFIKRAMANSSHIVFEVTERCNLKCKYCGYGEYYTTHGERASKNLSFAKAKVLLDYLYQCWNSPENISYGMKITISFYGGEPLLNFSLIKQIVEYSQQLKVTKNSFAYSITTNGTLLEKYINYLVKWDFSTFVSLDGDQKHNAFRVFKNGRESFSKVFDNLQKIQKQYPLFFKEKILFNSVFHKKSSFLEVSSFFQSTFNKQAQFLMLNTFGVKEEKKETFKGIYKNPTQTLDEESECMPKIKDRFSSVKTSIFTFMQYHNNNIFYEFNELRFPLKRVSTPTGTCIPFEKKLYLRPDGTILPCEKVSQHFKMGSISDSEVIIDYEKIASYYNQLFDDIVDKQCRNCENYFCKSCIFSMEQKRNGSILCKKFLGAKGFYDHLQRLIDECERSPGIISDISNNFKTIDL
jgi:uncharacterized protein